LTPGNFQLFQLIYGGLRHAVTEYTTYEKIPSHFIYKFYDFINFAVSNSYSSDEVIAGLRKDVEEGSLRLLDVPPKQLAFMD
jgi:hypothetical protein